MSESSEEKKFSSSTWQNILTSINHRKGHNVTKKTLKKDEKVIKYLTYLLRINMKMSARRVGRILQIDKNTVESWVTEFGSWSEAERQAITTELITGRRLPDKDALDDKYKVREYFDTDGNADLDND